MPRIVVIIPCYNESPTIAKVVADYRRVLPDARIIVYDNNSTDDSAKRAAKAGATVIAVTPQGKGMVIRRALRELEADCYLLVDGDDTYQASVAPEMCRLILEEDCDMVVGDRLSTTYFSANHRPWHNFGNALVRATINCLFGTHVADVMSGYRAFSRDFVKTFPVLSRGFEIETEMTIHAVYNQFAIIDLPAEYRDRVAGSVSKLHTFRDGARVLLTIFILVRQYKPLTFFGGLSLFLSLIATAFLIPVLQDYWHTGLVERFPTLIVCGFVFLAALLSLFAGLILANQEQNQRRQFELYRNLLHRDTTTPS